LATSLDLLSDEQIRVIDKVCDDHPDWVFSHLYLEVEVGLPWPDEGEGDHLPYVEVCFDHDDVITRYSIGEDGDYREHTWSEL